MPNGAVKLSSQVGSCGEGDALRDEAKGEHACFFRFACDANLSVRSRSVRRSVLRVHVASALQGLRFDVKRKEKIETY